MIGRLMIMLKGKGMYIWQVSRCERGDITAIAALARAAKLSHVLVKVADRDVMYNIDQNTKVDQAMVLIQALHALGIQAWGWQYVYGDSPLAEANMAIHRIRQLKLDGFVINAEKEYKLAGKKDAARRYMNHLRNTIPDIPLALSSYRYPSYHPEFPWREFLENVDINMPQVYWMQARNPVDQLNRCVREFQTMTPSRPIIPTGAAFKEYGWKSNAEEVVDFMKAAQRQNLSAINFWEWSHARDNSNLPGMWDAIRNYPWEQTPALPDICQRYINALNTRKPNEVIKLYNPNAIHVTGIRTIQGTAAINAWYGSLFNQVLPSAVFTLTGFSGKGPSRHFTWTAASKSGKVLNGSDTIGLTNDKIAYHFTFFTKTA
jgi:hypothetical protein